MTGMSDCARPSIQPDEIVLDTDDPELLGAFYAELLGWEVVHRSRTWVTIDGGPYPALAFQLAVDYVPADVAGRHRAPADPPGLCGRRPDRGNAVHRVAGGATGGKDPPPRRQLQRLP